MTPEQPKKQGMSTGIIILIIVGVCLAGCCVFGTLAAIAIPNFIKFQARSKQSECKMRLKAAYTAEKAYFGEKNVYTENTTELGVFDDSTRSVLVFGPSATPFGKGPAGDQLAAAAASH